MLFIMAALVFYPQSAQSAKAEDTTGKVDTGGMYTLFGQPLKLNGFITQESAWGVDPTYSGKNLTD